MDGTVGLSCQLVEISGRNYMLRHAAAELIRHDPAWKDGGYAEIPTLYMYAAAGNDLTKSPVRIQEEASTMAAAKELYDRRLAAIMKNGDVADQILGPLVRQVVAGLQHQHLKHQHMVEWRPASL